MKEDFINYDRLKEKLEFIDEKCKDAIIDCHKCLDIIRELKQDLVLFGNIFNIKKESKNETNNKN